MKPSQPSTRRVNPRSWLFSQPATSMPTPGQGSQWQAGQPVIGLWNILAKRVEQAEIVVTNVGTCIQAPGACMHVPTFCHDDLCLYTIAIGRTGEPVAPCSLSGRQTKVNS